jgi:hypothetical protein
MFHLFQIVNSFWTAFKIKNETWSTQASFRYPIRAQTFNFFQGFCYFINFFLAEMYVSTFYFFIYIIFTLNYQLL